MILALLAGLAIGVAAALVITGSGGDSDTPAATSETTRDGDPEALAELPEPREPVTPEAADDPESALASFLTLEAAGEWEASYEFLTDDLRSTTYPSPAEWVSAHADFPTVTGYRIDDVTEGEDGTTATVATLTGFQAGLDPVLGLVAARGRSTWQLQQDGDVWRVNVAENTNTFLYPASDGAETTVRRWVDARVACEDSSALEQGLIGSPSLAEQLCTEEQDGTVGIGDVASLPDSADTSTLVSEFGPQVFTWARTVSVDAATPLTAVLGPVGEEWRVVAVLPGT
ncbi:hypothetical protein [Euzebya tangerina]|uniref:hypothetical protein n=1 Tax=Euzebya tangerina TaxID=591198 RepID=UPI000E30F805|nr:hypothetical protein [Euzebya tangerina]